MNRFLNALAILCFFAKALPLSGAPGSPARPDILLLMADQFRGDCLSTLHHPVVRTPTLDELAHQGTLFRRAYSTCPSCIPARHSLLTGLFPASSGVVGYAGRPIPMPTLPRLLADAGYRTVLVGRFMHQLPETEAYGYQTQILSSTYKVEDQYDRFLRDHSSETNGLRGLAETLHLTFNGWGAKPWPLAEELHPTSWTATKAEELSQTASTGNPLFLTASFIAPHPPLIPPARFLDYYSQQNLPTPARGSWVDWKSLSTSGDQQGHRVLLEGETLHTTQAGYFGMIEHLDHQLHSIIAAFQDRSRKAGHPWLILFTADHGEMLGDHGFFRKCEPYEGSANIPLLVAASPELAFRAGQRCQAPVCLEDIMPTLLELAGVKCHNIDGKSLVPILRGTPRFLRSQLHLEHAVCYSKEQAFHALTDGRYKFIWRPWDGSEQLFDLDTDPREEHDLSRDVSTQPIRIRWRNLMTKELAARPEGFSDGVHLIPGRPYPPLQSHPTPEKGPAPLPAPTGEKR